MFVTSDVDANVSADVGDREAVSSSILAEESWCKP